MSTGEKMNLDFLLKLYVRGNSLAANGCKHEPFNTNLNWNNELNINHNSKLEALQNGLCLLLANRKNYEINSSNNNENDAY